MNDIIESVLPRKGTMLVESFFYVIDRAIHETVTDLIKQRRLFGHYCSANNVLIIARRKSFQKYLSLVLTDDQIRDHIKILLMEDGAEYKDLCKSIISLEASPDVILVAPDVLDWAIKTKTKEDLTKLVNFYKDKFNAAVIMFEKISLKSKDCYYYDWPDVDIFIDIDNGGTAELKDKGYSTAAISINCDIMKSPSGNTGMINNKQICE